MRPGRFCFRWDLAGAGEGLARLSVMCRSLSLTLIRAQCVLCGRGGMALVALVFLFLSWTRAKGPKSTRCNYSRGAGLGWMGIRSIGLFYGSKDKGQPDDMM
jgi:hypothetical protein